MAQNGMYLSLGCFACIVAFCASGCSAADRHTEGTAAHSIDSGAAEAGAELLDAAERDGGGDTSVAPDAHGEPPEEDHEDSGAKFGQTLPAAVAATLRHCSITTTGEAETIALEVPSDFQGAQASQYWPLSESCVAGGWDLARCAGKTAQLTTVHTDEMTSSGPGTHYIAHVIALNDFVCCVTLDEEGAVLVGAPPAAPCGPAYTARTAMQRCNIHEYPGDRGQTVEEVDVPSSFSSASVWKDRDGICRDGKYDLAKCAGKRATLVSLNENTRFDGVYAKRAWILTHESDLCCIWATNSADPTTLLARECAEP